MKSIMKYIGALLVVAGFVGCSDWNIPEREVFENQQGLENTYRCWKQNRKPT